MIVKWIHVTFHIVHICFYSQTWQMFLCSTMKTVPAFITQVIVLQFLLSSQNEEIQILIIFTLMFNFYWQRLTLSTHIWCSFKIIHYDLKMTKAITVETFKLFKTQTILHSLTTYTTNLNFTFNAFIVLVIFS